MESIIYLIGLILLIFLVQAMLSMAYCDNHKVSVPKSNKELFKFLFLPYSIGYVKNLENKRENYLDIE
jgi:hypothetical protein